MIRRCTATSIRFSRRYLAALRHHLTERPRAGSQAQERLGRQALAAGLETLDLAKIHEQALLTLVLPGDAPRTQAWTVGRASAFFLEALTPIESAHCLALEINGRSNRLNGNLRQHTGASALTHRRLTREIGRRKAVEQALKRSQQHYGRLLEKSGHTQEELRHLTRELLSAQEQERQAISRELHDEIGQVLTAVNVTLAALTKEATANTKSVKNKIASTQRLVEKSMNTVHRFARELRPQLLDDLGLIPALHSYMKGFAKRTGIRIRFTAVATVERLGNDKRTALYRVTQEALTHVAKHAHATRITVTIQRSQGVVRMEIHDDGKSFEAQRVSWAKGTKRLGLLGMRERMEMVGGSLTVQSTPGKGTTICAQIPFSAANKESAGPLSRRSTK